MKTAGTRHKKIRVAARDMPALPDKAGLVYVCDSEAGIERIRKGKGFVYLYNNKPVKDKDHINRIRKLAIPPAWTRVWICPRENGHIQATGFDARERKQYRYHPVWCLLRNETKFHRLKAFGEKLPLLRLQVEKDLSGNTLNEPRVIATIISLMERTYIRIGNAEYEKSNGSYGLTTLHDRHVMIGTGNIRFTFKGKKGIFHNITLRNRKLARIVQQCRDIPGKELFQYYDDEGKRQPVDSGMVNRYIHEHLGEDFSAKDFRTWAGSLSLLRALQNVGMFDSVTECRHKINLALDEVSSKLGNTRTVCRKYYVHPGIIRLYEENQIQKYLDELDKIEAYDKKSGLTSDEKVLMELLGEVS